MLSCLSQAVVEILCCRSEHIDNSSINNWRGTPELWISKEDFESLVFEDYV